MSGESAAILRMPAVLDATGLSRTTLWRRVRAGDFPAAVRLGEPGSRAVGWRRAEVESWLTGRPRAGPHEQEPPGLTPDGSERSPRRLCGRGEVSERGEHGQQRRPARGRDHRSRDVPAQAAARADQEDTRRRRP